MSMTPGYFHDSNQRYNRAKKNLLLLLLLPTCTQKLEILVTTLMSTCKCICHQRFNWTMLKNTLSQGFFSFPLLTNGFFFPYLSQECISSLGSVITFIWCHIVIKFTILFITLCPSYAHSVSSVFFQSLLAKLSDCVLQSKDMFSCHTYLLLELLLTSFVKLLC